MLTNIIRDSYKIKHGLNLRVHYLITQLFIHFLSRQEKRKNVFRFDICGDTMRSGVDIIPLLWLPGCWCLRVGSGVCHVRL